MARQNGKSKKRPREQNPNLINPTDDSSAAPKPKRQFTEHDHKLSNVYERLADDAQPTRLQAAKDLLAELFPESGTAGADAIDKAIRRLVRGLCSSRKAARYGFFVALTEVLRQAYGGTTSTAASRIEGLMPLDELMRLVLEATRAGGQAGGQEKRDHAIGRMYAFKSIVESGVVFEDQSHWLTALDNIMDLAVKTPWLREECGVILVEAIRAIGSRDNAQDLVRSCLEVLVRKQLWKTPEGVAIWITAQISYPAFSAFPDNAWARQDPLAETNRKLLYKTMREQFNQVVDAEENQDKTTPKVKGGFWQQSVHTAWEVVLGCAMEQDSQNHAFAQLWQNLVDEGLFDAKASAERKFWGFQLFTKMIKVAPESVFTTMFSTNFVSQLLTCLPRKNHMLHEGALEATRKMKTRAKKDSYTADKLILGLLGQHGSLLFDRHTKSKTVEDLLGCADPQAFVNVVDWLDDSINDQKDKEQEEADNERTMIADLLLTGIKAQMKENSNAPDPKITKKVINVLVKYAYCKPRVSASAKVPQPAISPKSCAVFHDRLSSVLGQLITDDTSASSKWPWHAVDKLHSFTKSTKDLELALDAEKNIKKIIKNAFSIVRDLEQAASESSEHAIVLLYSLSLLQAYSGDGDAVDLLSELNAFFGPDADHQSSGSKSDQILEILLSFVSKPSQLYRKLANEVFPTIAADITNEGLQSLYAILQQPETLGGQSELFDKVEDIEEGASNSSDSELDSDVEMVNGTNGKTDDSESGSASDSDTDDDDVINDAEEPDQELTEFEAKLAQALKTSAITNGADQDDNESDDASMNDEEMMAIEPKLAAVFRERQKKVSKPKEQKRAKEHVVNFKRRVLDLLKLYIKQEHASVLALSAIIPLLHLLRSTKEKSLQNDAVEILKLHAATCQRAKLYPQANADTWTVLAAVHEEARHKFSSSGGNPAAASAHLHGAACSRASLFIARVLLRQDRQNYDRVAEEYAKSMKHWFVSVASLAGGGKAGSVQATFFTEWVSWCAEVRKSSL